MGFNDINLQVSGPQQPASIYKTKVLKGQVPFAVQVTEPNTKYVIKHNFDLDGANITIPANCILEFDGGSLNEINKLQIQDNSKIHNGVLNFKINSDSCLISVNSKNIVIDNCIIRKKRTINSYSYGEPHSFCIFLSECENVKISKCRLEVTDYCLGILLIGSLNCDILNNIVIGDQDTILGDWIANGIMLSNVEKVRIIQNHIKNTSIAIYALPSIGNNKDVTIENNHIEEVIEHGMCFYHPNEDYENSNFIVTNNHIHKVYGHSNTSYGTGIYVLKGHDFIITNNLIHDICINTGTTSLAPSGVGINQSPNCTVENNIIYNSGQNGIYGDGDNTKIIGNYVHDVKIGIVVRIETKHIIVSNNIVVVDRSNYAVSIGENNKPAKNAIITGNYFESDITCFVGYFENCEIVGNIIVGIGSSFNVSAVDSTIIGNRIQGKTSGAVPIMMGSYSHCFITNNKIDNETAGAHLRVNEISNNSFCEGNFFDNQQALDVLPINYTKKGITGFRPYNPNIGTIFFDTQVGKPIWNNGTDWVDATGTTV